MARVRDAQHCPAHDRARRRARRRRRRRRGAGGSERSNDQVADAAGPALHPRAQVPRRAAADDQRHRGRGRVDQGRRRARAGRAHDAALRLHHARRRRPRPRPRHGHPPGLARDRRGRHGRHGPAARRHDRRHRRRNCDDHVALPREHRRLDRQDGDARADYLLDRLCRGRLGHGRRRSRATGPGVQEQHGLHAPRALGHVLHARGRLLAAGRPSRRERQRLLGRRVVAGAVHGDGGCGPAHPRAAVPARAAVCLHAPQPVQVHGGRVAGAADRVRHGVVLGHAARHAHAGHGQRHLRADGALRAAAGEYGQHGRDGAVRGRSGRVHRAVLRADGGAGREHQHRLCGRTGVGGRRGHP
eukprot:Unigene13202_Nuclearia_a/m.39998 Unigene13202_Nuclearia_a/g.39998  ORF Unigene13202_Nuclearia_a/g.39998 Unigene13202_Nuclearia_a/m.39998 type:complete len:358 (+) Unigene13202_Nuclearia_a:225-1298(+)